MARATDREFDNTGGVWECGHCHRPTTETHFYRDRATGEMGHAYGGTLERQRRADQCGWRFDDDYGTLARCELPHDHRSDIHRGMRIKWRSDHFGSIAPADQSLENRSGDDDD